MARFAASTARVSPDSSAGAHQRHAHAVHDSFHIRKVEVDQSGNDNEIGNALDRLAKNIVRNPERVV